MYILLIVKIAMCKKPYPDLIHKKLLLLTSIKNTRGHYANQKFYVYNQPPVPIRTFRPTTWSSDRRNNINACDSRDRYEECYIDAALDQGKLSWRSSSSRYWESHDGRECRETFLEKHKTQCENLNFNNYKNWDSNNLKQFFIL